MCFLCQIPTRIPQTAAVLHPHVLYCSLYWDTIVGAGSPIEEEQEEKKDEDSVVASRCLE